MKKIVDHIKQADKSKRIIYIFSFLIFLGLNNFFSNLIFYSLGEYGLFNYWNGHRIPCQVSTMTYALLFQGLKLILFILFIGLFRLYPTRLINEFFIAYFSYDLVYLLFVIWDTLPIKIKALDTFSSSGQAVFDWAVPHLCILISAIWTLGLLLILGRQQKLTSVFLVNRLVIILISIPLIFWTISMVAKLSSVKAKSPAEMNRKSFSALW